MAVRKKGKMSVIFLDRFDTVSDLRGKNRTYENIKAAVLAAGRFSCFDVETEKDGVMFTELCRDPEIETFDMGYPWTGVRRRATKWFAAAILAVKETDDFTLYENRPAIFQATTKEGAQEYFLQKAKTEWYPESEGWTNHKVDVIEFPEEAR